MKNLEQTRGTINGIYTVGFSRTDYDLLLTDSRLIFIHTIDKRAGAQRLIGAAAGGAVGAVIVEGIQNTKKPKQSEETNNELQNKTIDELLKSDKKNFAIALEGIVDIKLRKNMTNGEVFIATKVATKGSFFKDGQSGSAKHFFANKNQIEPLVNIFNQLPQLQGKIFVYK